jgi:hypothetical protein
MSLKYDKHQGLITLNCWWTEAKHAFGMKGLEVPDSLHETLKNIEQGFKIELGFNFAFKEFLQKKTGFDILFKGFKFYSEVSFLRKIKKIMIEGFKDAKERGSTVA